MYRARSAASRLIGYVDTVTAPRGETPRTRWGLIESIVGFVLALLCMAALITWLRGALYYDGHVVLLLSYAVVWVPLLGAVMVAVTRRRFLSPARDLGLRLTWLDVFFGVGVGLLARAVAGIIEIAFTGRMIGLGVTFGETVYDGWWIFGTILAPVVLAPFVEELFFRGLLQRAVLGSIHHLRKGLPETVSIVASALLFSMMHVIQAANPTAALVLCLSSLTFGLASALLAALTGRIGASIVAHITFNGALVLTSLV